MFFQFIITFLWGYYRFLEIIVSEIFLLPKLTTNELFVHAHMYSVRLLGIFETNSGIRIVSPVMKLLELPLQLWYYLFVTIPTDIVTFMHRNLIIAGDVIIRRSYYIRQLVKHCAALFQVVRDIWLVIFDTKISDLGHIFLQTILDVVYEFVISFNQSYRQSASDSGDDDDDDDGDGSLGGEGLHGALSCSEFAVLVDYVEPDEVENPVSAEEREEQEKRLQMLMHKPIPVKPFKATIRLKGSAAAAASTASASASAASASAAAAAYPPPLPNGSMAASASRHCGTIAESPEVWHDAAASAADSGNRGGDGDAVVPTGGTFAPHSSASTLVGSSLAPTLALSHRGDHAATGSTTAAVPSASASHGAASKHLWSGGGGSYATAQDYLRRGEMIASEISALIAQGRATFRAGRVPGSGLRPEEVRADSASGAARTVKSRSKKRRIRSRGYSTNDIDGQKSSSDHSSGSSCANNKSFGSGVGSTFLSSLTTFNRDVATRRNSEGTHSGKEDSTGDENGNADGDGSCDINFGKKSPTSFPGTPFSRNRAMNELKQKVDSTIFHVRDLLRIEAMTVSRDPTSRLAAERAKDHGQLAVFDSKKASEGLALCCGNHCAMKVGKGTCVSVRGTVPILRNCYVYMEYSITVSGRSVPYVAMGLVAPESPLNVMVGSWNKSIAMNSDGHLLVGSRWFQSNDAITMLLPGTTVGLLIYLESDNTDDVNDFNYNIVGDHDIEEMYYSPSDGAPGPMASAHEADYCSPTLLSGSHGGGSSLKPSPKSLSSSASATKQAALGVKNLPSASFGSNVSSSVALSQVLAGSLNEDRRIAAAARAAAAAVASALDDDDDADDEDEAHDEHTRFKSEQGDRAGKTRASPARRRSRRSFGSDRSDYNVGRSALATGLSSRCASRNNIAAMVGTSQFNRVNSSTNINASYCSSNNLRPTRNSSSNVNLPGSNARGAVNGSNNSNNRPIPGVQPWFITFVSYVVFHLLSALIFVVDFVFFTWLTTGLHPLEFIETKGTMFLVTAILRIKSLLRWSGWSIRRDRNANIAAAFVDQRGFFCNAFRHFVLFQYGMFVVHWVGMDLQDSLLLSSFYFGGNAVTDEESSNAKHPQNAHRTQPPAQPVRAPSFGKGEMIQWNVGVEATHIPIELTRRGVNSPGEGGFAKSWSSVRLSPLKSNLRGSCGSFSQVNLAQSGAAGAAVAGVATGAAAESGNLRARAPSGSGGFSRSSSSAFSSGQQQQQQQQQHAQNETYPRIEIKFNINGCVKEFDHDASAAATEALDLSAIDEIYPCVSILSEHTRVWNRYCESDIVYKSRDAIGAPEGVRVYCLDGSLLLSEEDD